METNKYTIENFHPNKEKKIYHIGLIPDGASRWGVYKNVSLDEAYDFSLKKVGTLIEYFFNEGIKIVSIYFSSSQNFSREKEKIQSFCTSQANFIITTLQEISDDYGAKINFAGNENLLPPYLLNNIHQICNKTANNKIYTINICAAYNPLDEIIYAIKKSKVDNSNFINSLWIPDPIDLIIRTSGANLLSNFLPIQAGYARLYFIDKLFIDTDITDYKKIIDEFLKLERRYGN